MAIIGLVLLIALPSMITLIIFLILVLCGIFATVSVMKDPESAVESAMEYNAKLDEKEKIATSSAAEAKEGETNELQPTEEIELDRRDYEWICKNLLDVAPKSFSGYRRMKSANSENYKKLRGLAEAKGYFSRN